MLVHMCVFFFFKQKTAYEMRISDWSSDVCSSDLRGSGPVSETRKTAGGGREGSGAAGRPEAAERPRLVTNNTGLMVVNIGKSFKMRPVRRGVTLALERGEAVGLLGPNGAGKTTCFYIVTGLISPDYGWVTLDGHDITDMPMYRRARLGIGYLPQEASIFRGLTVEQNIRGVLEVTEPVRETREAMLESLLAEFSITHLRRTPAVALSGGERRRVEIARALARSERRRVGKECVGKCRSRGAPYHSTKKHNNNTTT